MVYSEGGRSVGLVVDRIVDIVEDAVAILRPATRAGVRGSAVIQGRVTDLLDVPDIIRGIDPSFFVAGEGVPGRSPPDGARTP